MEGKDSDAARLRVGDKERHQVAEILRRAAGDGRIDLGELDERLEVAFSAKTYADLVPLTADLPEHPGELTPVAESAPVVPGSGARLERRHVILSSLERKGVWRMPEELSLHLVLGSVELDLRRATFAARECVLDVKARLGSIEITVGPDVHVVIEGGGVLSSTEGPADEIATSPDAPTLRVRGSWVLGSLEVRRKPLR